MNINVQAENVRQPAFACPTIFELFTQETGEVLRFRLRHGVYSLTNLETMETLAQGDAPDGLDGSCTLEEAVRMLRRNGGVQLVFMNEFRRRVPVDQLWVDAS